MDRDYHLLVRSVYFICKKLIRDKISGKKGNSQGSGSKKIHSYLNCRTQ
jgi:hypothetical protein